nr:MAG TPA: tail assembly chaperone protein [Caudoviricetes sp.]
MTGLAVVDGTLQGYVDITLSRPVDIAGAAVSTLRMREPTVGDQLVAEKMRGEPADRELTLFANLCEVMPDDLKRLPMRDYKRVQQAYSSFLD